MEIVNFADIVEKNGKTIKQNNLEKKHNIPIGALVEFDYKKWFSGGAEIIGKARMYIFSHPRDSDGTPLYNLSFMHPDFLKSINIGESLRREILRLEFGYSEDSLKVVEVDEGVDRGENGKTLSSLYKIVEMNKEDSCKAERYGISEDEVCNRDGCKGIMKREKEGSCSCHINPPCSACVDAHLVCSVCGFDETDA